jgi:hypothetical protein
VGNQALFRDLVLEVPSTAEPEHGSEILVPRNLSKFVETIKIAHRCRRIIMQNFWGTLIVDNIGVWMAAVDSSIHSLPHSSMSVPSLPLSSTPLAGYPAEAADAIDPEGRWNHKENRPDS